MTTKEYTTPHYQKQITKRTCTCGYFDLKALPIKCYPHDGGWPLLGIGKQWLYVTCPKCKYEWALWKLGVPRS